MQTQYLIEPEAPQVPPYNAEQMAQGLAEQLAVFLFPLLVTLDQLLDKRLVRTFLQTIQVILAYRDRIVLHHLDLSRSLPELRRVLKPGGRVAFTVWDAPERAIGFGAVYAAKLNLNLKQLQAEQNAA